MRTAATFLLPALLLLPGASLAAELVSIDFSSRPGEFRTILQVSDETFSYSEQAPSPGKILLELRRAGGSDPQVIWEFTRENPHRVLVARPTV